MSLGDVKGDSSAEVLVAIGRTGLEERATSTSPPASREKTSGTVHPLGHERVQAYSQPEGDAGLKEEEVIVKDQLNPEEQEILEKFERDELRPATGVGREMAIAPQAARNTFKKTRRVNLRVTERDFNRAHARAREEGIPYQTLLSSVIHKHLSGRLTEKR